MQLIRQGRCRTVDRDGPSLIARNCSYVTKSRQQLQITVFAAGQLRRIVASASLAVCQTH